MNRISELHTIVRVSNICNKNGLIKEADQLLNIFTKLAQENPDLQVTEENPDLQDIEEVTVPQQTSLNVTEPTKPIADQKLEDIANDINDYNLSAEKLVEDLNLYTNPKEAKQLLPELSRVIDLIRTIVDNPNLDQENKNILLRDLPMYVDIQESLKLK
jgi:hypothetical protein